MHLAVQALLLAVKIAGPFLVAGLLVGLLVSIMQAATQIQEMTLQMIPKMIVFVVVLVLAGPWMLSSMVSYTTDLYHEIPTVVRGS